jgi:hypothetical protein
LWQRKANAPEKETVQAGESWKKPSKSQDVHTGSENPLAWERRTTIEDVLIRQLKTEMAHLWPEQRGQTPFTSKPGEPVDAGTKKPA